MEMEERVDVILPVTGCVGVSGSGGSGNEGSPSFEEKERDDLIAGRGHGRFETSHCTRIYDT